MEEHKRNYKPVPGIAEALHPEIGNSSALEEDKHAFVLRIPDPAIQLSQYLSLSVEEAAELSNRDEIYEGTLPFPIKEILSPEGSTVSPPESDRDENISEAQKEINFAGETQHEQDTLPKKGSRKRKESKPGKKVEIPEIEPERFEPIDIKPQKAGKLLRKAAKSVKKQEEEQKNVSLKQVIRQEPTLSPYTSWLKNLAGSDYVHPYEDDFAFEQATGPSKEGISETFADLLAAQGYKDQAREMYIKLMEKYPEKSGFFAAKIEALQ